MYEYDYDMAQFTKDGDEVVICAVIEILNAYDALLKRQDECGKTGHIIIDGMGNLL